MENTELHTTYADQYGIRGRKANLILGAGVPKVVTRLAHGRYFRGLVAQEGFGEKGLEYSVEVLIDKNDGETMKAVLEAMDASADNNLTEARANAETTKQMMVRAAKQYSSSKAAFVAGRSNTATYTTCVEGEEEVEQELANGEFSIITAAGRVFHWPIKDGDLSRRNVDVIDANGETVQNSVLESSLEVGRGGEVAGHWIIRIKKDAIDKKTKKAIRPAVLGLTRTNLGEEDVNDFVSLDCGMFKFETYAFCNKGKSGISTWFVAALLVAQTSYRVMPAGTVQGGNDADGFDDDFEDEDGEDWDK